MPNVVVHYALENQGVASARNWLLQNCRTRYALFLDADDELCSSHYVQDAVALLNDNPEVAVVGCFAVDQYGEKKLRPLAVKKGHFLWRNPIVTSGAVVRCQVAVQFEVVDPSSVRNFAEDYYFWARLCLDNKLVNLPVIAVKRESSEQSLTSRLVPLSRIYVACLTRLRILAFFLLYKRDR